MTDHVRLARYAATSSALALLSDHQLAELVAEADIAGSGIGGTNVLLDIDGTPVFAKRIALTELESRPENVRSTADLFGLPVFAHYGVGSPGFGAWRELAGHVMTTNWVVSGECPSFPLMYHWRVVPGPPAHEPTSHELADVPRAVEFWNGSAAMGNRIEAILGASSSLVVFLEYVPHALKDWLPAHRDFEFVERELRSAVPFMNSHGLFHFDAHFGNILTDGHTLYLTDFGLATSPLFDLRAEERDFLAANPGHDEVHTITCLVNVMARFLPEAGAASSPAERAALIQRCADGRLQAPPIMARYAPVATVVNDFYRRLMTESRQTPYPAADVLARAKVAGLDLVDTVAAG